VFLSALNIFLAITGSLGNVLILNVLPKTSLHSQTKLLFGNLAVTDLCVGLISQPLFVTIRLSAVIKMDLEIQYYLMNIANAFDFILCGVSILTLSAISVDRLLALFLGIRYRAIVNLRHTRALLSCFWLSGISGVLLSLFTSFSTQKTAKIIITICLTLCLIISLFSYTKIVLKLRQHQSSVRDNVQQRRTNAGGIPLNLDRYKRIVVSIALVQQALVICYFPFLIFHIVTHLKDIHPGHYLLWYFHTSTLIFLNSSLNPFLYCWRIKEIRQAVKATITGLCAC
ncbi:unnamed protein product, partial [Porites lobata]